MQHYSFFNKKIVIPIQAYGYVAEGKVAMLRLQNDVLQHVRWLILVLSLSFSTACSLDQN